MRTPQQKLKALLKLSYKRRKHYEDPYYPPDDKLHHLLKHIQWHLGQSVPFNMANIKEVSEENYVRNYKLVHYVGLFNHHLPYWLRDQFINCLLDTLIKWQKQASALQTSYDLKAWIFQEHFKESQIVFATNGRARAYSEMFALNDYDANMPFLTLETKKKLTQYHISYHKDFQLFSLEDLEDMSSAYLAKLALKMGYPIEERLLYANTTALNEITSFVQSGFFRPTDINGETHYDTHVDNIWVIGPNTIQKTSS